MRLVQRVHKLLSADYYGKWHTIEKRQYMRRWTTDERYANRNESGREQAMSTAILTQDGMYCLGVIASREIAYYG